METERSRTVHAPGRLIVGSSALLSTAFMFAMEDWWPIKGRTVDAMTNFAIAMLLGAALLVVGLGWAIKSMNFVGRERRWSWWIAFAPVAVIVVAAIALLIPSASFESSRGEFDAAAQSILSLHDRVIHDVQIGPYEISNISRSPHGAVYFYDSDRDFHTVSGGWVYSPAGPPPEQFGADRFSSTHIVGPWYQFTARWTG